MRAKKEAPTPTEASIDPVRNFSIAFEERMRAAVIGPPSYAVRKRRIEEAIHGYEAALDDALASLVARTNVPSDAMIEDRLREAASRFDIDKTNALIAAHNRYYAIEANLPMDPRTGGYLLFGKPWRKEALVTLDALIERARDRFFDARE